MHRHVLVALGAAAAMTTHSQAPRSQPSPAFSVRPKSFWDRVGHWFGSKDVEFESHPAFNSACLVKGNDDVAIRAAFTEPLLDYLVVHPNVQLEGNGERLMYYRGARVKPEQLRDFMAEGFEVLNLFPAT